MPVYVLGTGLSHDGSACLLKDGVILAAIEKERLTRKKHDGGNDTAAIQYCLDAAGITVHDLDLVVQNANFEKEGIPRDYYCGRRLFTDDVQVPIVSISHHLAHAYSALGTCPFDTCSILVIDGCGSPLHQCDDLHDNAIPAGISGDTRLFCEKDSYYRFDGNRLTPVFKDFSEMDLSYRPYPMWPPTTRHSIGGVYSAASGYCFGNMDDAGKLMGLAPYGTAGRFTDEIFALQDGRVFVNEDWMHNFLTPAGPERPLTEHFHYYADVARYIQQQVERAILYVVQSRLRLDGAEQLCYSGGVALNAVANARIRTQSGVRDLYLEPAAGDNGIAVGCAWYGWLEVLQRERVRHNGSTCFGVSYPVDRIDRAIARVGDNQRQEDVALAVSRPADIIRRTAELLADGKVIGWFQQGSEFGPRALGRRSILADPRVPGVRDFINAHIKFREDFRPFAPAVLRDDLTLYFEQDVESPYMILVNRVRPEWRDTLRSVVHEDDSARVQTVTPDWNPDFHALLREFKKLTGISVLLNTSFNRRGMPIVETPEDALGFFTTCALDCLVLDSRLVEKVNGGRGTAEEKQLPGAR